MRHLLIAALLLSACAKKPTEGGVRIRQVNDSLSAAGLKIDSFKAVDPGKFSAQQCSGGEIEGVDTVLCEYGSVDAMALGKKAAETWIDTAPTGAVLANGRTILAVAARGHVDPNGKIIHKITQAFKKTL